MNEKWERIYDDLRDKLCALCFGILWRHNPAAKTLMEAWMEQNGLGSDDVEDWLDG